MGATVLFVCPHGAGKSRMAAAWFNGTAPAGWTATSAGVTPQSTVSRHAPRLLAGTAVAHLLDEAPPRPVSAVPDPVLVVAIDCQAGAMPGAVCWTLDHAEFDDAMCEEIRLRVQRLADVLPGGARR
jgi:protein-tyrosine-phosphatase